MMRRASVASSGEVQDRHTSGARRAARTPGAVSPIDRTTSPASRSVQIELRPPTSVYFGFSGAHTAFAAIADERWSPSGRRSGAPPRSGPLAAEPEFARSAPPTPSIASTRSARDVTAPLRIEEHRSPRILLRKLRNQFAQGPDVHQNTLSTPRVAPGLSARDELQDVREVSQRLIRFGAAWPAKPGRRGR